MMDHKICFYGEMWLIIPKLSLLPLLIWSIVAGMANNVDPDPTPSGAVWHKSALSIPNYLSQYLEILWYTAFFCTMFTFFS